MPSRKSRRQKRGGQPTPETPARPALPGSIALGGPPSLPRDFMPSPPEGPPRLVRSPPAVYSSPPVARRIDFETGPGCAPIYKRLPGHAPDQCESAASADAMDRIMCLQPGQGQVQSLDDCGPARTSRAGKRRSRKTKKLKRKHRKV